MRKLATVLILFPIVVLLLNGCTQSVEDGLPGKASNTSANTYHPAGWKDNPQHGVDYSANQQYCRACHGNNLQGGSSGVSCVACHHGWTGTHGEEYAADPDNCKACHGADLTGGLMAPSCSGCHHSGWIGGSHAGEDLATCQACHGSISTCADCHHTGWDSEHHSDAFSNSEGADCTDCHDGPISTCADCHHTGWSGTHGQEYAADADDCKACHAEDLNGDGDQDRDCGFCHHKEAAGQWQHGDYHTRPDTAIYLSAIDENKKCTDCHGADFTGANSLKSCFSCHSAISAFGCADCHTGPADSYTDSAHGNTSYGGDRSGTGYTQGDCTHCHDLPAGSTNGLLLFAAVNPTSQTDNFCFQCHKATADSVQTAMPNQYSYSYRASGDATLTPPDDILEAFSFIDASGDSVLNCGSTDGSSHRLADITIFVDGKWGYTADSNPCTACHNPHSAERDPHADGDRGWPVSLPNDHIDTSTWGLWGDVAGERMSQYITDQGGAYQAPNHNTGARYEPDGSTTQNGSNLTDYVTSCTDCHNSTNTIYSNVLDRNLKTIDWDTEKHGNGNADNYITVDSPYTAGSGSLGYVLSCLDCHEPHGSPNAFLIRKKVNGGTLGGTITKTSTTEWHYLCDRCHKDDLEINGGCQEDHYYRIHHDSTDGNDRCYTAVSCGSCHSGGAGTGCGSGKPQKSCIDCHFHGSSKTDCDYAPATRVTF